MTGTVSPASAAQSAPPEPAASRSAPYLDPGDPNGAWAGYSVGTPASPESDPRSPSSSVLGMDVSGHQRGVNWKRAWDDGARFAYIKVSEGNGYTSPAFDEQFQGATSAGMMRGGYHFALPDRSPGSQQANLFVDNGGGWAADGRTMPGAVDIETNPYGEVCYGMNPQQIGDWLADFSDTYASRTGRRPMIYTTSRWWHRCTADNPAFANNHPLWIARYNAEIGALPAGWNFQTIWQFSNKGKFPGDQNSFNGTMEQLKAFTY